MRFIKGVLAAWVAVATFGLPQAARACACCAEPGTRFNYDLTLEQTDIEEFARLRGVAPTRLFLDACGGECVTGISEIAETYSADFRVQDGVLQIVTRAPAGTIRMPLSQEYRQFGVDTDPLGPGYQRDLYQEFTFTGQIAADGIFATADHSDALLVLAGRSNMCWSAENFTHWMLFVGGDVDGDGAGFQLYGGLEVQ